MHLVSYGVQASRHLLLQTGGWRDLQVSALIYRGLGWSGRVLAFVEQ